MGPVLSGFILKTYEASRQRTEICKPEGCTWGSFSQQWQTELTNALVFGGEGGREKDGGDAASHFQDLADFFFGDGRCSKSARRNVFGNVEKRSGISRRYAPALLKLPDF
jgi:hypothetical protein